MKSRKTLYKAFNIGWRVALFGVVLVGCAYVAAQGLMNATEKKDIALGPEQTINTDSPLDAKIFFNNEVGESKSLDLIINTIGKAQHSIEIAVFSLGSEDIKRALYAANERGVKVTLILDKSKYQQHDKFLTDLPIGIRRIDTGNYDALNSRGTSYMHDKMMLVDRGFPSASLITGSLNFTTWGEKYNQSFFLATNDPDILSIYEKEFDLLENKISGIKKLAVKTYNPWAATINYSDSFLEIWFSPGFSKQSIKYRILDTINASQKSLDLIMWDLTDQNIASALVKKAEEGVKVRIIASDKVTSIEATTIPYLKDAKEKKHLDNLEIILDTKLLGLVTEKVPDDFSPLIHHHSVIADGKTLIFGSGNWSLWGFYQNDENAFVTDNKYLIEESQKTFEHFYKLLK